MSTYLGLFHSVIVIISRTFDRIMLINEEALICVQTHSYLAIYRELSIAFLYIKRYYFLIA